MSGRVKFDLIKNCLPVNSAVDNGRLVPALAPVCLREAPARIRGAFAWGEDVFAVCREDGSVYISLGGGYEFLTCTDGKVFAVSYVKDGGRRNLLVCGDTAYESGGQSFSLLSGVRFVCGTMCRGRLFASDGKKIYWSGGGGAEDWSGGIYGAGSLVPDPWRGEICNIVNFRGKIAVVAEYGITAVSVSGAPEKFAVESTETDADGILPDTAAVAAGELFFFTRSGLKSFDGARIKSIVHRCGEDIFSPCGACGFGDKYFAACGSETLGRAVFCYDACAKESYLADVAAEAVCAGGGVYAFAGGGMYRLERGYGARAFAGGNFGTGGKKVLLSLAAAGAERAVVTGGGKEHAFSLSGGAAFPVFSAKNITVEISGGGAIENAVAEVGYGV